MGDMLHSLSVHSLYDHLNVVCNLSSFWVLSLSVGFCTFCRKRRRGVFWKLLGLSMVTAGGVVGYAWYDKEFKKTIEENVPYSKEGFSYVFQYFPESFPYFPSQPSVQEKP